MTHKRLNEIAGVTDVGMRRQNNEDAIAWDPDFGLALVADGIGGNNAGEVASVTVARSIKADLPIACGRGADPGCAVSRESRGRLVQELVRRAHQRIRASAARDPKLSGMGTTLAMVLLAEDFVTVVHVGDSRVYRLRSGRIERLTVDHQLSVELAALAAAGGRRAPPAAHTNMLTRALGTPADPIPDIAHHDLHPDDLYLLCSDGLTLAVSDEELADLLCNRARGLHDTALEAVALANRRGGRDNVSVVLMRLS